MCSGVLVNVCVALQLAVECKRNRYRWLNVQLAAYALSNEIPRYNIHRLL